MRDLGNIAVKQDRFKSEKIITDHKIRKIQDKRTTSLVLIAVALIFIFVLTRK